MLQAPRVEQHIARPAVKTQNISLICSTEYRQIGHAPQVQNGNFRPTAAKHCIVKGWYQWRALAAGCHISAAEIGNHIDAAQLGQQRRVVQLQRVAGAIEGLRLVPNCLAMRTDCPNCRGPNARLFQQRIDHLGIGAHQRVGR